MVHGGSLSFLVVLGGLWWFFAVLGGSSWFFFCASWAFLVLFLGS